MILAFHDTFGPEPFPEGEVRKGLARYERKRTGAGDGRNLRGGAGAVVADSSPKGGRLRSSWKKLWKGRKRKALALLLVVAIAGGVVIWRGRGQTASAATTYQEAAVERRSITNSLSSSGTLEPADSYTVNTLVSGEILSDTFEKGDQVERANCSIPLIPPTRPAARPRRRTATPRPRPPMSRR